MFAPVITETDADITRRHIAALVEKLPPELQEEILILCRKILENATNQHVGSPADGSNQEVPVSS